MNMDALCMYRSKILSEAFTDHSLSEEMMHERGLEEEIQVLLGGGVQSLSMKDALGQLREKTLR